MRERTGWTAGLAMMLSAAAAASVIGVGSTAWAGVEDFTMWTGVEDPPNAFMSASASATTATLTAADGPIGSAVDVGYQSVDGATAGSSTAGYAFEPGSDFSIAIDFDLSFVDPSGFLGIGFGVGEDGAGMNSAGVAMLTSNGGPLLTFAGAARVNDVGKPAALIGVGASVSGSMFVSFDSTTGSVTVGASPVKGAAAAAGTTTYAGIQDEWNQGQAVEDDLLASFFLRSEGWVDGQGEAVFSNFRVLSGEAVAVPEPASALLVALGVWAAMRRRRGEGAA